VINGQFVINVHSAEVLILIDIKTSTSSANCDYKDERGEIAPNSFLIVKITD
jgi:hypothetical protein